MRKQDLITVGGIILACAAFVVIVYLAMIIGKEIHMRITQDRTHIAVRDVETGCVWRVHYNTRTGYVTGKLDPYRDLAGEQVCGALPE